MERGEGHPRQNTASGGRERAGIGVGDGVGGAGGRDGVTQI